MSDDAALDLTLEGEGGCLIGRLPLPVRVRVQGIEAVLVSAVAYDAIVQAADKSAGMQRRTSRSVRTKAAHQQAVRLTRVDKDPDPQRFILTQLGTEDVDRIRQAAIDHFGPERVPSRSAVARFAMKMRATTQQGQP